MLMPYNYTNFCRYNQISQDYRMATALGDKKSIAKAVVKLSEMTNKLLQVDLVKAINNEVKKLRR